MIQAMGAPLPSVVLWEVTYACPLRCIHCYSESGVRPSRQLGYDEMLRVAEALARMGPRVVHLSGGEPLVVRGLLDVVERLAAAGVAVVLTTSGHGLTPELASGLSRLCHSIHVSVDGADAATHDRIRGRDGSFASALEALAAWNELSRLRRGAGGPPVRFGIDFVLLRSNFHQLRRVVTELVPRFGELEFVIGNGVVPQGLASREGFEDDLLTDEQTAQLADPEWIASLAALAPDGVVVQLRDNVDLRMHPDLVESGTAWTLDRLIVEPDGEVRALEVYEGHVGNVLTDSPEVLWERTRARRSHPLVRGELATVHSSAEWAAATRRIDRHFASPADQERLDRRKPYTR